MKTVKSNKIVMVDCDETLVHWCEDTQYENKSNIKIEYFDRIIPLYKNESNIKLVKKLSNLGYKIFVWSGTGYSWATKVVEACELQDYVHTVMSKPRYHIDDEESSLWIGRNLYIKE